MVLSGVKMRHGQDLWCFSIDQGAAKSGYAGYPRLFEGCQTDNLSEDEKIWWDPTYIQTGWYSGDIQPSVSSLPVVVTVLGWSIDPQLKQQLPAMDISAWA